MAIDELLGAMSARTFLDDYFLKLPLAMAGGCRHCVSLGSMDVVRELLARPDVDVLVGRQGQTYQGPPPGPDDVRRLLDESYTIGIRHAERHYAPLAELAAAFHTDFAAAVDIHVYVTPAGQPGFGWHYDAEDVFILQTHGAKQWSLRKNTVNPWPLVETIPQDMRYRAELMPLSRCTLAAGDWLYIPAGYWHATQAGEESISLSVGLMSMTALDLFDALRPRLVESLRWRQRLPCPGRVNALSDEELLAECRSIVDDLAGDLARQLRDDELLRALWQQRRNPSSDEG